jgi:hypothetical protein
MRIIPICNRIMASVDWAPPEPQAADITASVEPTPPPAPVSQHIAASEPVSVAEPPAMSEVAYLKQPVPRYPRRLRKKRSLIAGHGP